MTNNPTDPVAPVGPQGSSPANALTSLPTTPMTGTSSSVAGMNSKQTINSIADLKAKQPELYNMMMQGIANTIINEMRDHQQKLKEIMRKAQQDAERR